MVEIHERLEAQRVATDDGELRADVGPQGVLFAGDDVTDEDAFAVLGPDDVGIKVGDGHTAAQYRVADPDELAAVLVRFLELRETV